MFSYRITKYNPIYRNEFGWYLKEDWTAYGDIGRKYNNEIFTVESYLDIENKYIQAIVEFMKGILSSRYGVFSIVLVALFYLNFLRLKFLLFTLIFSEVNIKYCIYKG